MVAFFVCNAAAAEGPTLPTDVQNAIGRLNNAGYRTRNMCSAVLVSPDTVLTAAHCVPRDPAQQGGMRFVAGWNRGDYAAVRGVAKITYHPKFTAPTVKNIPYDIAILRLDAPITDVRALPIGRLTGQETTMSGYLNTRPHIATTLGPCPTQRMRQDTLIMVVCPTAPGYSGAPVLGEVDGVWSVLAITSAANEQATFAVRVNGWAAETLALD